MALEDVATVGWYRRVSQFHENSRLIDWATRPWGQLLVFLIATALLWNVDHPPPELSCTALALVLLFPAQRGAVLTLSSIVVLLDLLGPRFGLHFFGERFDASRLEALRLFALVSAASLVLAFCFLCYRAAVSFQSLPGWIRRRPLVCLHAIFWLLLFGAAWLEGKAGRVGLVLVGATGFLTYTIWRMSYLLLAGKRGSAKSSSFGEHLLYHFPVFGGTGVPYGKGHDHLKRHRADDVEARARSQLAGLKLLFLAGLWTGLQLAMDALLHGDSRSVVAETWGSLGGGQLDLPRLNELIAGQPLAAAWPLRWLSLFLELIARTLTIAIQGHVFIGLLRLFGYPVFRNTYKPLLAESVMEFWSRFYHYFKELLVEFFFLPTYVRFFRTRPKLRILAATFAAAFVGNIYFHVVNGYWVLVDMELRTIWDLIVPRAFYSFLLATGIFVSLLREQRRRGTNPAPTTGFRAGFARLRRIAGVWLFFALIHIWNVLPSRLSFGQRNEFFLSLFQWW